MCSTSMQSLGQEQQFCLFFCTGTLWLRGTLWSKPSKSCHFTTSIIVFYTVYVADASTPSLLHPCVQGHLLGTSESFYSFLQL